MGKEDYRKAYKQGKRDCQWRMLHGEKPILKVLDDILPEKSSYTEVPLGLMQIPLDQIVGTKTVARSNAFAGNFMPILREDTEFAIKWIDLLESQMEEGIRDPIKVYEYMYKFYVEEGNKRVSVMKYSEAVSILGDVIRIVPKRTEEKENKIYYEFLDFYALAPINYMWFTQEGSYARLQKAVGKKPQEAWTDEDLLSFSAIYTQFCAEYQAKGGDKLPISAGDAFLAFITLYGYEEAGQKTTNELKTLIAKSWEEFVLLSQDSGIELMMSPNPKKPSLLTMLRLPGQPSRKLKIAFIYEKTPGTSAWTYAHELGRLHLEQTFPEEVHTECYENVSLENIEAVLEEAVASGCDLIFTTTPPFAPASVKAAIANPRVQIVNCSLNTSHRYIRTYYSRMYEAKFLMGAIAGAMAENDKISYIADYPIYGVIANINAFALGAKMINPRAKVYLEWSTKKEMDLERIIRDVGASCMSGKDMAIPEEMSRLFGVYHVDDGHLRNFAMPLWHWGKFYERLILAVMDGTWKYDDTAVAKKAINYWWGMSEGVIDIVFSKYLPIGLKRLANLLGHSISTGAFNPFAGVLYSQTGIVADDPNGVLSPEEIMTMDWLAENIIGSIPDKTELKEQATPLLNQQGIKKKEE